MSKFPISFTAGQEPLEKLPLAMLLALHLPLLERVMGGVHKAYRLHKWTGIAAAVIAMAP